MAVYVGGEGGMKDDLCLVPGGRSCWQLPARRSRRSGPAPRRCTWRLRPSGSVQSEQPNVSPVCKKIVKEHCSIYTSSTKTTRALKKPISKWKIVLKIPRKNQVLN